MDVYKQSITVDLDIPDPEWPTRREDLTAAMEIMQHYQQRTGRPLRLVEQWAETEDGFRVKMPEWVIALTRHFDQVSSSSQEATDRVQRVMHTLLSTDETPRTLH